MGVYFAELCIEVMSVVNGKAVILIAEDEVHIRNALQRNLTQAGYEVVLAVDGADAIAQFRAYAIDLVVLDILMPKLDGLQVCRLIRQKSDVPIIMATVLGSPSDRVVGLDLGANDYIVKPFSSRELIARIRSILRRLSPAGRERSTSQVNHLPVVSVSNLILYPQTRKVYDSNTSIRLTEIEFHILYLLAQSPGQIFTRENIFQRVWGYTHDADLETKALDVHISRLRTKLDTSTVQIMTIQGRGYMLLAR
ncbi:response regulator with -like receiver domain protein and winged-helix dna-binding domain protein [Leptolyngbya sp. Heron Island J]|uniref:response regulator n=1 Tax=Leptolyngbya sp. Heron Island J TaxID=1385935 RepID=UPI0003B990AA|nr:response regulator [Leptolyngbya sp. Heron Island J]ESA34950.1 response regulator with -like receiver domain protein and winged-helix dna-binding domain protein [Leptolyngbya sp. Heron Island J]